MWSSMRSSMRSSRFLLTGTVIFILLTSFVSYTRFQRNIITLTRSFEFMSAELAFFVRERQKYRWVSHRERKYNDHLWQEVVKLQKRYPVNVWKAEKVNMAQDSLGGRVLEATGDFLNLPKCPLPMIRNYLGHFCCPTCKILRSGQPESGDCVAFKGTKASFVIKLHGYVHIMGISLEHIEEIQSPSGEITSAPSAFSLSAIADDGTEEAIESFVYTVPGPSLQTFMLNTPTKEAFRNVKINFYTNHGHPEYTCIYRLKIHGILSPKSQP